MERGSDADGEGKGRPLPIVAVGYMATRAHHAQLRGAQLECAELLTTTQTASFKKRFLDPPAKSTNERHISARRRLDEQASLPSQREESEKKTRESQVFVDLVLLALSVIEP